MSEENKKFIDPLHEQLERDALKERKKREVLEKELVVRERRANSAIEKIEEGDKASQIAKNTSYGALTEEDVAEKQKENTEYMYSARNKMSFINKDFDEAIPFFRKNLILIGGRTGEGKSTTVANIIREMLAKINPTTGKKRRILVLTNEEKSEDVYNRVTCLIKGYHYTNHDKFTDEQIKTFNQYIKLLSADGMITVVDDSYHGATGTTTTLEGICQVFDNLLAKKEYYDAVLIDYYQNVKESRKNPGMNEWEVQAAFARKLDQYKNIYPAPIVVLAQVQPPDADRSTPFKSRIEGRKSILNVSTCCVEMIANREDFCTEWLIHKSRFNECVGESIVTGYDKGRYVVYDDEFKNKIAELKAKKEAKAFDKSINFEPGSENEQ